MNACNVKFIVKIIDIIKCLPEGNINPKEDISITTRIRNAANLFDINVLDHVIVAVNKYYSFAMRGEV